jgi:hypothetical protein
MNDIAPNQTELDILVSKIEKLWRKASDAGASDAEREAFEAKALSLLERYRIDAAMLNLTAEDPLGEHVYGSLVGRYGRTYINLIAAVAKAYDCRCYYNHYRMNYKVFIFGFKSDADRVKRIAGLLLNDATAQAAKVKMGSKGATLNWRRAFIAGYTAEVTARFRQAALIAREDAVVDSGEAAVASAALVLVNRAQQVNEAFSQIKLGRATPTKGYASNGYNAGREAGSRADLSGGSRGVTGSRLALAR